MTSLRNRKLENRKPDDELNRRRFSQKPTCQTGRDRALRDRNRFDSASPYCTNEQSDFDIERIGKNFENSALAAVLLITPSPTPTILPDKVAILETVAA